jgi:oxygen-independent coproporphyrinogen-3 oxidase
MPHTGLYVHVPFCARKCPYCDFASVPVSEVSPEGYVDAVLREAELAAPRWSTPFGTLYVGGGTPTVLPAADLHRLISGLQNRLPVAADAEVTVEANPGSLDAEKAETLLAAGVSRLSLGVQSFDDAVLGTLGRVHTAREAANAIRLAQRFPEWSLDLIHAVPGQTVASAVRDARLAVRHGAPHVSAYSLTYEDATPFGARRAGGSITLVPEDDELAMFDGVGETLEQAGLRRYEVSNFARPGHESKHNQSYWLRRPYLGLGAGAHSLATADGMSARRWNAPSPRDYIDAIQAGVTPETGTEIITPYALYLEVLMMGLRMTDGTDWEDLRAAAEAAGEDDLERRVEVERELGTLENAGGRLRLTASGLRVADSVIRRLS